MPRTIEGSFIGDMPEDYPGGIEAWYNREDLNFNKPPIAISDKVWAAVAAEATNWTDVPAPGAPVIKKALVGTSVTPEGWTVPALHYDNDISASAWGVKETIETRGLDIKQWNDKTIAFVESTVRKLYGLAEKDFKGIGTSSTSDQTDKLPIENAAFMALQYIECERFVRSKDDACALIFEGSLPNDFLKLLPNTRDRVPLVVITGRLENLADAIFDAAKTDRPMAGKLLAMSSKLNGIAVNSAAEIESGALLPLMRDLEFIDERRPQGLQDYSANVALNAVRRHIKLHEEFMPTGVNRNALELKPGTRTLKADNYGSKLGTNFNIA